MTPRPKHTKPDENQQQIIDDLRDAGCRIINVSSLSGCQMELHETYSVREGDKIEDALDLFILSPCRWCWLQVEIKRNRQSSFRPGQIAYFRSLGNWSLDELSIPIISIPVMVVYNAGDVLNWFQERCGCEQCNQALLEWRENDG